MSVVHGRRLVEATSVVRDVIAEVREKNVPFMAGSIAYSAFVSLFPLLLLALLVASALGGRALADLVIQYAGSYLTPSGRRLVTDAILRAGGRAELSILGVLVLGWGVLKVFRGLDTAFSSLYDTDRTNDLADQLRDGVIVLGAITLAVATTFAASAAFALLPWLPFLGIVNPIILVIGLTLAFFPVYYVYPDRDLTPRQVLPGTVFAAVGWAILQAVFQVYVSISSTAELYGVVGAVLLVITWLYFSALVLLLGATVNVILDRHHGQAPKRPTAA